MYCPRKAEVRPSYYPFSFLDISLSDTRLYSSI